MFKQAQIDKLSLVELLELEKMIAIAKDKAQESAKQELLKEWKALAAEKGFTLEQVMGISASEPGTRKVKPKYVHPNDPTLTWAGRGQQPKWLVAYLKAGGKIEDCAV